MVPTQRKFEDVPFPSKAKDIGDIFHRHFFYFVISLYLRGLGSNLDSSCTPVFLSGVFSDRSVCRHTLVWDYHISSVWSWYLVYRPDHNDSTHPILILRHPLRNRVNIAD